MQGTYRAAFFVLLDVGLSSGELRALHMESFFASLKREELYRREYRSERELRGAIDDYMVSEMLGIG